MSQTRRLAAILAADEAAYLRLIGADESGTLEAVKAIRAELLDPSMPNITGDSSRERVLSLAHAGTPDCQRRCALCGVMASRCCEDMMLFVPEAYCL
jgi:hypothetical protein